MSNQGRGDVVMSTVFLIGCSRRKGSHKTKAADLYTSSLFRKSRMLAEQAADRWYILSAKYGIVDPKDQIDPYDASLNTMSKSERLHWQCMVNSCIGQYVSTGDTVIIIAGQKYRERLVPYLIDMGCKVNIPLQGKSIGRQLRCLNSLISPRLLC
jgi:hypothetical protein